MANDYVIIGTGAQARVTASIILANKQSIAGFIEINHFTDTGEKIAGFPVLGPLNYLHKLQGAKLALAIGDNKTRATIVMKLAEMGFDSAIEQIVHPTAFIEMNALISPMTTICLGAAIAVNAKIGTGAIINSGAIIEHDCEIGDYTHISVGVRLAGNVTVRDYSFVGIGATVKDRVTIGEHCTIGAGAVVLEDIPDYSVAVGVPARIIKKHTKEEYVNK